MQQPRLVSLLSTGDRLLMDTLNGWLRMRTYATRCVNNVVEPELNVLLCSGNHVRFVCYRVIYGEQGIAPHATDIACIIIYCSEARLNV